MQFGGGSNDAVHAGGASEAGEGGDTFAERAAQADAIELGSVKAGEHSDGEEHGRALHAVERGARGLQHGQAAGCVERHHADTGERGGGFHGAGDSVGNVAEFQVEEDAFDQLGDALDGVWPFGGEQLAADFDQTRASAKLAKGLEGLR